MQFKAVVLLGLFLGIAQCSAVDITACLNIKHLHGMTLIFLEEQAEGRTINLGTISVDKFLSLSPDEQKAEIKKWIEETEYKPDIMRLLTILVVKSDNEQEQKKHLQRIGKSCEEDDRKKILFKACLHSTRVLVEKKHMFVNQDVPDSECFFENFPRK